MELEFFSASNY